MPAPNAAALLRRNAGDPDIARRPAVRFEDRQWTHGEYVAECRRWANLFLSRRADGAPWLSVTLGVLRHTNRMGSQRLTGQSNGLDLSATCYPPIFRTSTFLLGHEHPYRRGL